MPHKRILNFLLTILTAAVLLGALYAVRQIIRRVTLEQAAVRISEKFFKGTKYSIDHAERQIIFAENEIEFLKKHKLNGKVIFSFPAKFFEMPWQINSAKITVEDVRWELDLKSKKINGFDRHEFLNSIKKELESMQIVRGAKIPAFMTSGTLVLINPEGKKRELVMKSIFQEIADKAYLLGIHAGDMKVNFLYRDSAKKVVGQYLAKQSDFEFIRLSFGIPELFAMHGVEKLSGEFCYDVMSQKLDFIRGSSDFGLQASIKGSIFTLYGNRLGKINWEYINSQNWQIELRNASSVTPVRAGLHYFVLSQNTLEKDALSFDGEIELNPNSFRDMFGLELDRRTSNIRHRIVGKWDMVRKSWELSRLETQKRVPQVKLKWNDFNIAFQWQNFKLSGRGDQADHFGFHYELDMSNIDWKDKSGNAVIGTQAKLEGDCILSLADDTLKPVSNGKISCAVADGAFGKSRFLVTNAFLNFSPDVNGRTLYHFSCGELKVGLPDLQNGVVLTMPNFEGNISNKNISVGSSSLNIVYKDILKLSGKNWSASRKDNEKNIRFELPASGGDLLNKKFKADKFTGEISNIGNAVYFDGRNSGLTYADGALKMGGMDLSVECELPLSGNLVCRKISLRPKMLKVNNQWMQTDIPHSSFSMTFNDKQVWHNWVFEAEKSILKYKNKEFTLAHLTAGEVNNGKYRDGLIKNMELPLRFDIAYSRKKADFNLKNARITSNGNILWGLTGDINLCEKDDFLKAKLQYAEFKPQNMTWENGTIGLKGSKKDGFTVSDFSGTSSVEMAKVKYIGRNEHGQSEFEVKNFPARYVEKVIGAKPDTFSGMFEGRVACSGGAIFNPFNIQTFYLRNNLVMRMRLGALEKFAGKGNSIEDEFAVDALKDFFAKTLILDYHRVGDYMVLNVNTLGKSTELLPYEYDIKAKKLKKSDIALFNAEVEVNMKYMMKKP